jgi:hypothetical protein
MIKRPSWRFSIRATGARIGRAMDDRLITRISPRAGRIFARICQPVPLSWQSPKRAVGRSAFKSSLFGGGNSSNEFARTSA